MMGKRYRDQPMSGLGKLRCNECGDPLRDHKRIAPCPTLGLSVIPAVHPLHADSNEHRRNKANA